MTSTPVIRLREDGLAAGPVLVLGNSLAASTDMWRAQVASWRDALRLLRFDYAGHGGAPLPQAPATSAAAVALALLAGLDDLGIGEFTYVGLSLGGMVGLQVAASAPDRVQRLVVANARYFQVDSSRAQWDERIAQARATGMDAIADVTVTRWFTEPFRQAHPDVATSIRQMIASTSPAGYAAAATIVRDFDARPLLPLVRCPTLLISGADDAAAPAAHMEELREELGARHVRLTPCAHLSNIECEALFTEEVTHFMDAPA